MPRLFDPNRPELMDRPQPVSEELKRDLENLVSLNARFGSHRLLRHFLRRTIKSSTSLRVLDLATGAGDLPREMVSWARSKGIQISVDAVDFQEATLSIAQSSSEGFPEISWLHADIRDFASNQTYDLVHCSLALHHFSDADAIKILRRCLQLSRRWTLVSDLERSSFATAAIWSLTQFFYRDPMTRYDARLSAQRAFSSREMISMARAAGWSDFSHHRFLFARQALWNERE